MGTKDARDIGIVILIDETYHIEIDNLKNHSLYKKVTTQTGANKGKEYFIAIGHYANVASALKSMLQDMVVNTRQTLTIEEYIYELEQTYQRIFTQLEQIGDRITKKVAIVKNRKEV